MMKKTLLHEVESVELEAAATITKAKEDAVEGLAETRKHADAARESIQAKAEQTSQAIIAERKRVAEQEAHQITQQSQAIASQIHQSADRNRSRALAKASMLLHKEYGTSL